MARKSKKQEEAPKQDYKVFEYGDLAIVCKCGHIQLLEKGVQNGIQLLLQTRSDSYIKLICDKCDSEMKLCFLEGEKPEESTTNEANESIQEESKQEENV